MTLYLVLASIIGDPDLSAGDDGGDRGLSPGDDVGDLVLSTGDAHP